MDVPTGYEKPNTHLLAFPTSFFAWMFSLSANEWKVLCYIAQAIAGSKLLLTEDEIYDGRLCPYPSKPDPATGVLICSLAQEGFEHYRADRGCGLSREAVSAALEDLVVDAGIISRTLWPVDGEMMYGIKWDRINSE